MKKNSTYRFSVYPQKIEISVQGISKILPSETVGSAEIILPSALLKAYVSTSNLSSISFHFKTGEMKCGSSIFESEAIIVQEISDIIVEELPINPTRMSVLRFA